MNYYLFPASSRLAGTEATPPSLNLKDRTSFSKTNEKHDGYVFFTEPHRHRERASFAGT